jgi:hypothetical protein
VDVSTERYGQYYWCVKTQLSDDGDVYVHADRVTIDAGVVTFWHEEDGCPNRINLAVAPGQWTAVYAASVLDGHAVAVDHWKGEVIR